MHLLRKHKEIRAERIKGKRFRGEFFAEARSSVLMNKVFALLVWEGTHLNVASEWEVTTHALTR